MLQPSHVLLFLQVHESERPQFQQHELLLRVCAVLLLSQDALVRLCEQPHLLRLAPREPLLLLPLKVSFPPLFSTFQVPITLHPVFLPRRTQMGVVILPFLILKPVQLLFEVFPDLV